MNKLEKLLFHQGGRCFFCDERIPDGEASVEHLVPVALGGPNADDNCVVCCKAVNAVLGSLTVKEKLRVVLNQQGAFTCPHSRVHQPVAPSPPGVESLVPGALATLQKMGEKRPAKLATLKNAITVRFPNLAPDVLDDLIRRLEDAGHVAIAGTKVVYPAQK